MDKKTLTTKAQEDKVLTEAIKTSFDEGRGCYGTRRMQHDLKAQELIVNRRRVGRLMKAEGLNVKTTRKFKATTFRGMMAPLHLTC